MKVSFLRKKYPKFIYSGYLYKITDKDLEISFNFFIEPNIHFNPSVIIRNIDKSRLTKLDIEILDNLIFHLGLMEIPSYWKVTCSPVIEIRAGKLNKDQIKWWKDLIINGMGQFFYENKIDWRKANFLKIKSKGNSKSKIHSRKLKNRVLIPIGGGKDSIVTLESLKRKKEISCFSLNPTPAVQKVIKIGKCKKVIVNREIDNNLLKLNRKGFLNGHTPFSAYLAFLSALLAVAFDYKYVAFSNERSSNEGNVEYLGKIINHQYSKSFDFEEKFKKYSKRYLIKDFEYFSFLRPLYEIQIAKLFSKYPKYFSVFLSCNEAFKTSGRKKGIGKWCGECSKCLFIYVCLYPFLNKKQLKNIFKKDLFEDGKLVSLMKQLTGKEKFKPFECVGTQKESLTAFYLSYKKNKRERLLKYFEKNILKKSFEKESKKIMNSWNKENNLPKELKKFLIDKR